MLGLTILGWNSVSYKQVINDRAMNNFFSSLCLVAVFSQLISSVSPALVNSIHSECFCVY